ncbi:MAG: UbiA family prenyltransferase [Patescibacteria group bacterium]
MLKTLRWRRWYINVYVIVGALLALHLDAGATLDIPRLVFVLVAVCVLSSANYALNEALDAQADAHHPEKKNRSIPMGAVNRSAIVLVAVILYLVGAAMIVLTQAYLLVLAYSCLLLSGLAYNIPPIRLKDVAYADFILEAVNSPIRLLIGWFTVSTSVFPASIFVAVWAFTIFLMAAKHFAEIRFIGDYERAVLYRKSFRFYDERNLLLAMVGAVSAFMFMLGVLVVRYEKNLIISMPLFIVFIVWLFVIAYQKQSFIQNPERVLSNKYFLLFLILLIGIVIGLGLYPRNIVNF